MSQPTDPYRTTPHAPQPSADLVPESTAAGCPARIGRYRVEKVLGQGGFGVVYGAMDEQLQRQVAIKVPHRHLVEHAENVPMYLAEARTVASLDHPHIVPVFDVGSTAEWPCFIVSKFIEGTTLAQTIKAARIPFDRAAELVATVAEALHYAHRRGLVHRDIKPGNILLDKLGQPFVVDFGLALRAENVRTSVQYAGTPAYMSPEQAQGEGHQVDGRSDIFSLGVVLYELLTGRRPFHGDMPTLLDQIADAHVWPPRQFDDTIPRELERICLKALAKTPAARYTTAKDFADDVRGYLAGHVTVTDENRKKTHTGNRRQAPSEKAFAVAIRGKTTSFEATFGNFGCIAAAIGGICLLLGVLLLSMKTLNSRSDRQARFPEPPSPVRSEKADVLAPMSLAVSDGMDDLAFFAGLLGHLRPCLAFNPAATPCGLIAGVQLTRQRDVAVCATFLPTIVGNLASPHGRTIFASPALIASEQSARTSAIRSRVEQRMMLVRRDLQAVSIVAFASSPSGAGCLSAVWHLSVDKTFSDRLTTVRGFQRTQ
jgi:serine/threonine protein kinase